jgi:NAD-dependent deacetylase
MNELDPVLSWIRQSRPRQISILTGAGVSAESGIPTFRGAGGLWENHRPEELATPEAFDRDPALVWRWYLWRRNLIAGAAPNAAHQAIAGLERHLPAGSVTLITQNVDGLHRRAGSQNVLELHGSIIRVRCTREGTAEERASAFDEALPRCRCGALLRPDVVWFGEALPSGMMEAATAAVEQSDLLLVVGTSGVVFPAAALVWAVTRGVAVEVNPDPTPLSGQCGFSIRATAVDAVPAIVTAIMEVGR